MAKHYPLVDALAKRIEAARIARTLSFERLGQMAEVNAAQAWRICQGDFATLNPSVLKICNALDLEPEGDVKAQRAAANPIEARLAAEAIAAWDRTEAGARLLTRVLRAFRSS